jgi:hypothetical protein
MSVIPGKVFNSDPRMSCQPCGCDPAARNGIVLGHYCANYPDCGYGKAETVNNMTGIKRIVPGYPAKFSGGLAGGGKTLGIGGAPTRATTLPDDPKERKKFPIATGVLDYFPDAIIAVSRVSFEGNEQHNPGKPLHWDRSKSADEDDTMLRHFMGRGTLDKDGTRHSAKMVWRALAYLQKEIEAEQAQQTYPVVSTELGSVLRNEEDYAGR